MKALWARDFPIASLLGFGLRFRLRRSTPLATTGYALLLNSGATSVLGLLYWAIAARFYTPDVLGRSSAVLSTIFLISGTTSIGTNAVLVRYLPIAGRGSGRLIISAYVFSGGASMIIAAGVAASQRQFEYNGPAAVGLVHVLGFVLAAGLWSVFTLQDAVLTGMRKAKWIPPENTSYGLIKLALLPMFAEIAPSGGILVSWFSPLVAVVASITWLIFRRLAPRHADETSRKRQGVTISEIARYAAANLLGSLFLLLAVTLLPLFVVQRSGARAAAYFYAPWTLMISLSLIATSLTTAMTVEGAFDTRSLAANASRAVAHISLILIPIVAIVLLSAPLILRIFGEEYSAHGTVVLRLLALSTVPNVAIALALALARVQGRQVAVIWLQVFACLIALGLAWVLLPRYGINGAAAAWLASQFVVAVVAVPNIRRALKAKGLSRKVRQGPDRRPRSAR